ncbi:MAG: HPr(Ser) kinase/phosphatase [Deltaproteobacteria bacterium CG11_big_fil_rev_8_21_14_0_20_49_13]|nr:MAG: HPr(Ser) kinase/phosphatase [Deltaproteobacteria bacterium CG11_big_fil_rev_8_21_14_0_20_49_13]
MLAIPVIKIFRDTEEGLRLTLIKGKAGLSKKVLIPFIQKPGLALAGDMSNLYHGRIQVLGKQEIKFFASLPKDKRKEIAKAIAKVDVTCFMVTCDNEIPKDLIDACEAGKIPLFKTPLLTSTFINRITRYLEDSLMASTTIHGVLMDVFGVGVLIVGKSGIGKSELALDLLLRGHRLVADDIVNIKKKPPSTLYGSGSEIIRYHMEIRGLGIINIRDLFGISAVRDRKAIELVMELHDWDPNAEYDRLGVDDKRYTLLDVRLPFIQIPVRPGRNLAAIVEVASRNHLLKQGGHHSAREFQDKLNREIITQGKKKKEIWEMIE